MHRATGSKKRMLVWDSAQDCRFPGVGQCTGPQVPWSRTVYGTTGSEKRMQEIENLGLVLKSREN